MPKFLGPGASGVSTQMQLSTDDDIECPRCHTNSITCGCFSYHEEEAEALEAWKKYAQKIQTIPTESHAASEGKLCIAVVGGQNKVRFARWHYVDGKMTKRILSDFDQRIFKSLLGRHQIYID